MARTVAYTQQGEPAWMALGRRWSELAAVMDADGAAKELVLAPHEVRTAKRYARAVEFLGKHYPGYGYAADQKPILAGSVVVIELSKLHQLTPALADEMAPRILSGELNTAEVRAQISAAVEKNHTLLRQARRAGSVWANSFKELAFQRLGFERLLAPIGKTSKLQMLEGRRGAMEPDMVATLAASCHELAIEVRAPRDVAAKSHATVAAQMVSQVAALLLRYDAVLLVLPMQAEGVAEATLQLWDQWVKPGRAESCKMYLLLLDENKHSWIRCAPPSMATNR